MERKEVGGKRKREKNYHASKGVGFDDELRHLGALPTACFSLYNHDAVGGDCIDDFLSSTYKGERWIDGLNEWLIGWEKRKRRRWFE